MSSADGSGKSRTLQLTGEFGDRNYFEGASPGCAPSAKGGSTGLFGWPAPGHFKPVRWNVHLGKVLFRDPRVTGTHDPPCTIVVKRNGGQRALYRSISAFGEV